MVPAASRGGDPCREHLRMADLQLPRAAAGFGRFEFCPAVVAGLVPATPSIRAQSKQIEVAGTNRPRPRRSGQIGAARHYDAALAFAGEER